MKKFIVIITIVLIFVSIIIFSSVSTKSPYLSISYTTYDNKKGPEGGMTTKIIIYDTKKEKLEELDGVEYTSQYPLGVYSRKDNKIYYSAENERTKGDDLFSLDLKTKKIEQLTDDLFAINEIIPREDDIILVAVKRKTRALRMVSYNKSTKEVSYENLQDDDTATWALGVNINDDKEFYTSAFSEAQRYKNAEMQSSGEADRYYYADSTVYKYDGGFDNKVKVRSFDKQKVDFISATNKYIILTIETFLTDHQDDKIIMIDLDTQRQEEIKVENYSMRQTALMPDNKTIFFIGYPKDKDNARGIYQYNLDTKEVKEIFVQEAGVGHINNFRLLNN